jgi:polyhydroxybutyrate depolymerase
MRLVLLSIILGALFLSGCALVRPRQIRPGETQVRKLDFTYNGLRRSYRLHVTARLDTDTPAPLVVVLHGGFSTARKIKQRSRWSELGDREGFHVIYPNGIGIFGLLQHWNAGFCCGAAAAQDVDDVEVVAAAIRDTSELLNIDPGRIYMTGFSNGAMLTHRFAAERTETLAAIAPVAGSVGARSKPDARADTIPEPRDTLPVILFHGREDPRIPYEGGPPNGGNGPRYYLSAPEAARLWAVANGCDPAPIRSLHFGGRVLQESWRACSQNREVQLYSIEGWGHRWPGPVMMQGLEPEDPLRGLDATEIIWAFFERYRRESTDASSPSGEISSR